MLDRLPDERLRELDLRQFWDAPAMQDGNAPDWDMLYQNLLKQKEKDTLDYHRIASRRPFNWKRLAVAASLLFIVGLTALFIFSPSGKQVTQQMVLSESVLQPRTVTLPDGTVVTLNRQSTLEYPAGFAGKTREVYLHGEAYFEVKNDHSRPFLVHSEGLTTRVLGTSFNVRAYGGDSGVVVTVSTGKVQVQKGEDTVLGLLSAGEQLVVGRKSIRAEISKVDGEMVANWRLQELFFDNVTLEEAMAKISTHFNVQVQFEGNATGNCRFTARFAGKDAGLKQVMDVITTLTNTSWKAESDKSIKINGEGCVN